MTRGGSCESWSSARVRAGVLARALETFRSPVIALAMIASAVAPASAQPAATPVKGDATLTRPGDYARLVIKLQRQVEAAVRTSGMIVVVKFVRPVEVDVDKLWEGASDFVSSARTDPDGSAIRLALARKATPNVMVAGERLFIDLLPDSWNGPPPSLPPDVVKELAERAKAAEKLLRQREAALAAKKLPPIRVRASSQPTFTRYVFELPDGAGVSTILEKDRLALNFDSGLSFDLADAKVASAPNIASITQKADGDSTVVEFVLIGDADVHSFREENNYIVDIGFVARQTTEPKRDEPKAEAQPPATVPAAVQRSGEFAPPAPPKPVKEAAVAPATAAPPPPQPARVEARPAPAAPAERAEPKPELSNGGIKLAGAGPQAAPAITGDSTAITVRRDSEGLKLTIPFASPTPGAVFVRADSLWMVFDSEAPLDISQIARDGGAIVRDARRLALPRGQAIRVRLNRPQLVGVSGDGQAWIVHVGDVSPSPSQPLSATRSVADPSRASVTVPLAEPGRLHRLVDPAAGDAILVVTGALPARGFVKRQNFVEFALLESVHGIAVQLKAEDVRAQVAPDSIMIARPGGLTLSAAEMEPERAVVAAKTLLDVATWRNNRSAGFVERRDMLWRRAAQAAPEDRVAARLDLARFFLANGFYVEAKAAVDAFLHGESPGSEESNLLIVRALASTLAGRPEQGLADLANPAVGAGYDSRLWKAMAYARLGKWAEARELFKGIDFAIGTLPLELQRIAIVDALRASLEVRDYASVSARFNELEIVGIAPDQRGYLALLRGRMAQALGRDKDALTEYRSAIASPDRASASEAKLHEVALALKRGETTIDQAQADLETLSVTWRGDSVEVQTLQLLQRIYEKQGRFRDALMASRMATKLQPDSDVARQMQDEAAALFSRLFNGPRSDDTMPPVQALALFYEFRELTPIGRHGDEMIRRLADRLTAVDLLDQAAELLQYQVEHRLDGSARAHVASKLAMIYLTNRKPDRALAALRATRIADLAGELRQQRLLLEARAQSDVGRHDLALDIIANLTGREAIRLRSDIHWAARRWRESSEQIELLHGERWKQFAPLDAQEKSDIIRAAIGYSLADDTIGLSRLKEKYAAKLAGEDDSAAFGAATKLAAANSAEFATIARMAASVDTLDGFLREMRLRFPEIGSRAPPPQAAKPDPDPTGALPRIKGLRRAEARR